MLLNREVDAHTRKVRQRLLISDFGTCAIKKTIGSDIRTGHTGTPEWIAPELLIKGPDGKYLDYDGCCDMWGLGLCLHFMAFGKLPWKSTRIEKNELEDEITSSKIQFPTHNRRSQEILQLIRILLVRDPDIRPTARDLILSIPIQNLLKKMNDPQFDNLNAEIVVQGPLTRTFAERSCKMKNVSTTLPLLPPSNPSTPEKSLNNSQNIFNFPIFKEKEKKIIIFQLLSFLYFTLKISSAAVLCGSEIPLNFFFALGSQFLAGLSLFLFKRIPHKYLYFLYSIEFIWTIFALSQICTMDTREMFIAFLIQLFILSLGYILLYSDYIIHRKVMITKK